MTDEPCARLGCGAPKAWHTNKNTIEDLSLWCRRLNHLVVTTIRPEGWCLGNNCACTGYLAPEPPQPERTAWVVELDAAYESAMGGPYGFVPLTDYLASHPQPAPELAPDCPHLSFDGVFPLSLIGGDLSRQTWRCGMCGGLRPTVTREAQP